MARYWSLVCERIGFLRGFGCGWGWRVGPDADGTFSELGGEPVVEHRAGDVLLDDAQAILEGPSHRLEFRQPAVSLGAAVEAFEEGAVVAPIPLVSVTDVGPPIHKFRQVRVGDPFLENGVGGLLDGLLDALPFFLFPLCLLGLGLLFGLQVCCPGTPALSSS